MKNKSDQELISAALTALDSGWSLGEAASWWKQRKPGRRDAEFARCVGVSVDQVQRARSVFEKLSPLRAKLAADRLDGLRFSHFATVLTAPDPESVLRWVAENRSSVAELRVYLRAVVGVETEPEPEPEPAALDREQETGTAEPAAAAVREADPVQKLGTALRRITRAAREIVAMDSDDFAAVLAEHLLQLSQELREDSELAGVDRVTVRGMLGRSGK